MVVYNKQFTLNEVPNRTQNCTTVPVHRFNSLATAQCTHLLNGAESFLRS